MRKRTVGTVSLLVGGTLVLFSPFGNDPAFAQSTEIKLFDEQRARPSGFPTRAIEQAEFYDSVPVDLPDFDRERQSAHISGGPDLLTPFVVDNFMTINHACRLAGNSNICANRPMGSCFNTDPARSNFRRAGDVEDGVIPPEGFAIDQILGQISPVNVTDAISSAGPRIDFTLCDFGAIRGNTELWLVIRDVPQCSRSQCKATAMNEHATEVEDCMQEAKDCDQAGRTMCLEKENTCIMAANDDLESQVKEGGDCDETCRQP